MEDKTYLNLLDNKFTVIRTEITKNPVTNVVEGELEVTYGPYPCRLGKVQGTFIQTSPQGIITKQLVLYTILEIDIKQGDIVYVNNTKYIVGNVYPVSNHHTEVYITYIGDA